MRNHAQQAFVTLLLTEHTVTFRLKHSAGSTRAIFPAAVAISHGNDLLVENHHHSEQQQQRNAGICEDPCGEECQGNVEVGDIRGWQDDFQ